MNSPPRQTSFMFHAETKEHPLPLSIRRQAEVTDGFHNKVYRGYPSYEKHILRDAQSISEDGNQVVRQGSNVKRRTVVQKRKGEPVEEMGTGKRTKRTGEREGPYT